MLRFVFKVCLFVEVDLWFVVIVKVGLSFVEDYWKVMVLWWYIDFGFCIVSLEIFFSD